MRVIRGAVEVLAFADWTARRFAGGSFSEVQRQHPQPFERRLVVVSAAAAESESMVIFQANA